MMRTTDFCFPLPDTEHPRLVSYRLLFETYASPLTLGLAPVARRPVNLAFHDALIASVSFLGLARGMFPPCASDRAVPLTPLSPPGFLQSLSRWLATRTPRPLPAPLREDETPSTTRGAFHRWGTLTLARESLPVS
jgi:hypothetical protein